MSGLHPCGAGRRSSGLRRRVPATAAFFASLAVAGPAFADSEYAEISSINLPATTVVTSDGTKYLDIAGPAVNIGGEITVELDVGVAGRIHSFKAWPRIEPPAGSLVQALDYKDYGYFQSYSSPRPKVVEKKFMFSIPAQAYEGFVVAGCNYEADKLRAQGLSDSEVFAEERAFEVKFSARLEAEMSGPKPVNPVPEQLQPSRVWKVVCLQSAIVASNLSVETSQVNSVTGKCEMQLSGSVMSNQPHTKVKFFYVAADGQKSDLKAVTTGANSRAAFEHDYPLSGGIKSGKIRVVGESHDFQSDWASFDCVTPPQDVASVLPPKAAELTFLVREEVLHRGLYCPSQIVVVGTVEGRGTASGGAVLFGDGQLLAIAPYSLKDGETAFIKGEHSLTWSPTQAQQTVTFALKVSSEAKVVVNDLEKTGHFVCRQVQTSGVAQGAAGGVSPGNPTPSPSQQAAVGQLVLPQAFAIQAPKGLVHKGEIRLSGGAANAKYKLKLLRKNGGGYVAVNAAQLPKQMTGLVASFPLKALTGGRDWRFEVCPAQQGQGACKTADFRLPRIGGGGATMKAPAPSAKPASQPKGATVFIVPGALK